jgi:hypothetical protein
VKGPTPPETVAKLVWDTVFQKCPNAFYYAQYRAFTDYSEPSYWAIVEYTNPGRPTLEKLPLSPAQKANGFVQSYSITMSAEKWRWRSTTTEGRYWSPFKDRGFFAVVLTKENGKWKIEEDVTDLGRRPGPVIGYHPIPFDAAEYTRGKLSCDAFSNDAPKPQVGYVCPGVTLHGSGSVGDATVPSTLQVFVTGKLGSRGEVLKVLLEDTPNSPEYRIYTNELKPTRDACGPQKRE